MLAAGQILAKALVRPRISATTWIAAAAAVVASLSAFAGLYPRFDGGSLHVIIALTSAPFAAALAGFAVSSRTTSGAVGRTLGLGCILGVASTILPSAILAWGEDGRPLNFLGCLVVGFFFGLPVGFLYALPIAVLTGFGQRHVRAASLVGIDRAARLAGAWLAAMGLLVCVASFAIDPPGLRHAAALVLAAVGLGGALAAHLRVRGREAWVERVRAGLEPRFRLRVAESRDDLRALPRLGEGDTVVEWLAEDDQTTSVYRFPAVGVAVATVDRPPSPR